MLKLIEPWLYALASLIVIIAVQGAIGVLTIGSVSLSVAFIALVRSYERGRTA